MRFGINLRGDLAKLSDAEIAARFEALIAERERMYPAVPEPFGNKFLYQRGLGKPFGRGLLHARIFYKLYGLGLSYFGKPSLCDLYLVDCELKDIRDELRRRIRQRKTSPATT